MSKLVTATDIFWPLAASDKRLLPVKPWYFVLNKVFRKETNAR
jgi:hypothetical protein